MLNNIRFLSEAGLFMVPTHSKIVDKNIKSGLVESISLLKNISGIGFVNFNGNDIVRHPLVKEILEAYK